MRSLKVRIEIVVPLLLGACADNGWRLADDYRGPTASLATGPGESSFSRVEWYRIERINGNKVGRQQRVPWPHPSDSNDESWTRPGHLVPAGRPITVAISGKDVWESVGAGEGAWFIDSVTLVGSIFDRPGKSVVGEVTFTPVAGGAYHVTGDLERHGSSMWIENQRTGQRVGRTIYDQGEERARE